MMGFGPISGQAISSLPAGTVVSAGTMAGSSVFSPVGRGVGVSRAAGLMICESSMIGRSIAFGGEISLNNQNFDFSVNLLQAILWQYNKSERLKSLVQQKQDWYTANQQKFWEEWVVNVFDLRTANAFGCAVWSIILGLPLAVEYRVSNGANWGFANFQENFEHGNFAPAHTEPLPLTLAQKRLALQLRYFQLTTPATIPNLNAMLVRLFGDQGRAWVIDNLDMTITYHFDYAPSHPMLFLFKYYDLLPRPAGVSSSITHL